MIESTHLLEPNFEASIENRDERSRLLTRTLSDGEEVLLIFGSKELRRGKRVGLEELLNESLGLVKSPERLKDGSFGTSIDTSEPLLNTTQPVTSKVSQRNIDPTLLMSNVHESDHAKSNFFVGHVSNILHN